MTNPPTSYTTSWDTTHSHSSEQLDTQSRKVCSQVQHPG